MMIKHGIIIEAENNIYTIETVKNESCGSCKNKTSCIEASENNKKFNAKIKSNKNLNIGDKVILEIKPKKILQASLIVYLIPLLAMFFSIYIFKEQKQEIIGLISLAGLVVGFSIIWILDRYVLKKSDYFEVKIRNKL